MKTFGGLAGFVPAPNLRNQTSRYCVWMGAKAP